MSSQGGPQKGFDGTEFLAKMQEREWGALPSPLPPPPRPGRPGGGDARGG